MRSPSSRFFGLGWLAGTLMVIASGASSPASNPEPTVEQALKAEFDAAGAAMRELLAHRAQGDLVGAAVAQKALQDHRARYLDLRRAAERLTGAAATRIPDGAARNPFAPDASMASEPLLPASVQSLSIPTGDHPPRAPRPRWDMYVSREDASEDALSIDKNVHERAMAAEAHPRWGMYGAPPGGSSIPPPQSAAAAGNRVTQASAEDAVVSEPPSKPFFAYRDPQATEQPTSEARVRPLRAPGGRSTSRDAFVTNVQ